MPAAIFWTEERMALLPRSQVEAQRILSQHYFSGNPCPHGHVAPRYSGDGKCITCRREAAASQSRERRRTAPPRPKVSLPSAGDVHEHLTATGKVSMVDRPSLAGIPYLAGRRVHRDLMVEAVCSCGKTVLVRKGSWGAQKSCYSCSQRGRKTHGLSSTIAMPLYNSARMRAKKRGLSFTIKITDIKIPERCPILGMPLDAERRGTLSHCPRDNAPSIDRIDPKKGYTPDNIMVISYRANVLKNSASPEEIYKMAEFMRAREKLSSPS